MSYLYVYPSFFMASAILSRSSHIWEDCLLGDSLTVPSSTVPSDMRSSKNWDSFSSSWALLNKKNSPTFIMISYTNCKNHECIWSRLITWSLRFLLACRKDTLLEVVIEDQDSPELHPVTQRQWIHTKIIFPLSLTLLLWMFLKLFRSFLIPEMTR